MSYSQLEKELKQLRCAMEPVKHAALLITYETDYNNILKIDNKDVSKLSEAEKLNILSKNDILFFLPKKDPYPGNRDTSIKKILL